MCCTTHLTPGPEGPASPGERCRCICGGAGTCVRPPDGEDLLCGTCRGGGGLLAPAPAGDREAMRADAARQLGREPAPPDGGSWEPDPYIEVGQLGRLAGYEAPAPLTPARRAEMERLAAEWKRMTGDGLLARARVLGVRYYEGIDVERPVILRSNVFGESQP